MKKTIAILCLIGVALFITSCNGPRPRGAVSQGPSAVVFELPWTPSEVLDFTKRGNPADEIIIGLITGSLTGVDPESPPGERRYIGSLAEGLPVVSRDGHVWTFRMRDGLMFSDGTPITAFTFEDSLRALLTPQDYAHLAPFWGWGPVRIAGAREYALGAPGAAWQSVGISALNRLTLQFTLEEPAPSPLGLEILNPIPMHPAMEGNRWPLERLSEFPSSGPYRAVESAPGRIVFERNPIYPNAFRQAHERIELRFGQESGSFYGLHPLPPERELSPWFIYINAQHPYNMPLWDENLRKALHYGLNRDAVLRSISDNLTPITGFIPLGTWVGDPFEGLRLYENLPEVRAAASTGFDPARAMDYFNAAFRNNGYQQIVLTITCFGEAEEWGILAVAIRDWWMALFGGERFHLLLELMPMEEAYAAYIRGDFELGFGSFTHCPFNIWATMAVWSSAYPGSPAGFYSPAFDNLQYEAAFRMTDYQSKIAALMEMDRMLLDFMPAIPLFQVVRCIPNP